jgi:sugar lactone lactonase YvrE
MATSVINTFAGNGTQGYSGDGGSATGAALDTPGGLAFDSDGNLFIADSGNNRIRRVDKTTGIITTVAGNGSPVYSGDGGPATDAGLTAADIQFDSSDNLYLADWGNDRIRRIDKTTAIITTVAGNGTHGYSGDGGPATDAGLENPQGLLITENSLYIADTDSCRIRSVTLTTGTISTLTGTGVCGYRDGLEHYGLVAQYSYPERLAYPGGADFYISDSGNDRIRDRNGMYPFVYTLAGTGIRSYSGDGGLATQAALAYPRGIAFDALGILYIADYLNNRIRMIRN